VPNREQHPRGGNPLDCGSLESPYLIRPSGSRDRRSVRSSDIKAGQPRFVAECQADRYSLLALRTSTCDNPSSTRDVRNVARATVAVEPIQVGELPVHPLRLPDVLSFIISAAAGEARADVYYANAHAVNLAATIPEFRDVLRAGSLVLCDGKGVQWAARALGRTIPDRFTPPDWLSQLSGLAAQRQYRLFLLGGRQGVAEGSAQRLRLLHPSLSVRAAHGYFEAEPGGTERVVESINSFRPHILLVGMGMPKQEYWIRDHLFQLDVRVAVAVGAAFEYVSGSMWRAPRWVTDRGFEWLTRLIREPRRLARRYLLGNPLFVWRIAKQVAAERFGLRTDRPASR
jgi:N-acetylglucosaminyldiphosphoundecaprenol N-acetyl-beta-D-mannosaminyltransferase